MSRTLAVLRLCLACTLAGGVPATEGALQTTAGESLRVTGDRVNLRSGPGEAGEVVGQVADGQVVTSQGQVVDGFVRINPPSSIDLWIYGDLVEDDTIIATKVRVRGGPGINYREVGRLDKPARVTVRGREGDWVRIAPPKGSCLWISESYVSPAGEPAPKPESAPTPEPGPEPDSEPALEPTPAPALAPVPAPKPAPALEPAPAPKPAVAVAPVLPAVPAPKPKPVPKLEVRPATAAVPPRNVPVRPRGPEPESVPDPEAEVAATPRPGGGSAMPVTTAVPAAGPLVDVPDDTGVAGAARTEDGRRMVEYSGTVSYAALVWRRPSRYRLVQPDKIGRPMTVCYLLHAEEQLEQFVDQRVRVLGEEYWVQGVRYPVVVPREVYVQEVTPGPAPTPDLSGSSNRSGTARPTLGEVLRKSRNR